MSNRTVLTIGDLEVGTDFIRSLRQGKSDSDDTAQNKEAQSETSHPLYVLTRPLMMSATVLQHRSRRPCTAREICQAVWKHANDVSCSQPQMAAQD